MTAGILIVLLSAIVATFIGRFFTRLPSLVLSLVAAAACYEVLVLGSRPFNWLVAASWPAAMALSLALSAGLTLVFRQLASRTRLHYLVYLHNMSVAVDGSLVVLALGIVLNFTLGRLQYTASTVVILLLVCVALGFLFIRNINKVNEQYLELNPEQVLAVVLSVAIVLLLFSFDIPSSSMLSPILLAEFALLGNGLAKGNSSLSSESFLKAAVGMLVVPVCSVLLVYFASAIASPQVFDGATREFLIMSVALSVVFALLLGVLSFRLLYSRRESRRELSEREDLLSESKRAVSSLEIRTMQVENEYLRNHLQLKQREVVNVAVGIGEQKEFIEKIYNMVLAARAEVDQEQKNKDLKDICTELRLRMNFSDKIDGFYADVEKVHKDFVVRLQEKYPLLTKQERRLAMLLRLEFSSKYIATLMNISPKSVEISRHRLRSKLGLDRSQSLTGFIKTI